MKANEAPEKIYIQSFNVSEEKAKFDKSKMFFDDIWTEEPELGQKNIEYTRTDAFIEKACSWLKTHSEVDYFELIPDANYCGAGNLNKKKMIEDFEEYLKK